MIHWEARRIGPFTFGNEGGKPRFTIDWRWFIRPFIGGRR